MVATFVDTAPIQPITDYSVTIDWGDGSTSSTSDPNSTVKIEPAPPGGSPLGSSPTGTTFLITGTHTYNDDDTAGMEVENSQITVTIDDSGGSHAVVLSQADVADPVIFDPGVNASAVEGTPFQGTVATFTDSAPQATPGSFTTTINWGDGQASAGTVVSLGSNQYKLVGTHTFKTIGSFPVGVTITDNEGNTVTDTSTIAVADAPIAARGSPIAAKPKSRWAGTLAMLTDDNPGAAGGTFAVTIDWGDGTRSAGTVVPDGLSSGRATFTVTGQHSYARRKPYHAVITITDDGGSQAAVTDVITVGQSVRTAARRSAPHQAIKRLSSGSHPKGPLEAAVTAHLGRRGTLHSLHPRRTSGRA